MASLSERYASASGVSTPAARWIMVLVWCSGVLQEFFQTGFSASGPLGIAAYAATLGCVVIVTSRRSGPLHVCQAVLLIGCAFFAAIVVLWQHDSGSLWLLRFTSYAVALAIPRGNPVIAGIGGGLLVAMSMLWLLHQGVAIDVTLGNLGNSIASLIVGFIWLFAIRRFVGQELKARQSAAEAESREMATALAFDVFRDDLNGVRALVQGPIEAISAGHQIDDSARLRIGVIEARVRDGIRAPQLRDHGLDEAIAAARSRGVEIVVLGESNGRRRIDSNLAQELRKLLEDSTWDRVTLRILPPGREGEVSVVLERGDSSQFMVLPDRSGTERIAQGRKTD